MTRSDLSAEQTATEPEQPRRKRVLQAEVPRYLLREASRVPEALAENFAKSPTRPIELAVALGLSPTSGGFRTICGAALGYGLTTGGPNSQEIGLTELGKRVVGPLSEGDDDAAKREAVLTPRVERQFLERYDGHPLPADNIAHNVLESMGVPRSATARVYEIIRENAEDVGFVKLIRDKAYVDLGPMQKGDDARPGSSARPAENVTLTASTEEEVSAGMPNTSSSAPPPLPVRTERVFVSGSAHPKLAEQIAALLEFGGREAVAKTELEASNTSHLLALTDEMRECSSGVFFLSTQAVLDSPSTTESMLLELGAAVALFGSRCVLVVEAGAHVPLWLSDLPNITCSSGELTLTDITAIVSALMSADEGTE